MKIVMMGTPRFAVPILEMLDEYHQVLLVVTQPDKPVGRKKTLAFSPVKQKALELNIPVFQPEKLKTDYKRILELHPDLIITAAYGQMLPNQLLNLVPAINVHGSLLPKYRGGAPIQYALFDGLNKTGVTIMHMAYLMDSGDIIRQEAVEIDSDDNYEKLSDRLSIIGAKLLDQVLKDMGKKNLDRFPQDPSQVTYAYTLKRGDEQISFSQTTQSIINRIRGLSPEPGAYASINNTLIKFYKAQISDIIDSNEAVGTVLETRKKLVIKTLDSAIEILEVQIPGKNKMSVKDFLNGQSIIHKGDVFIEGKN
jgi:methionyl-tRNA formyltransferase